MIDQLKVREFIDKNHSVETISEDLPLNKAKSIMILKDYSQLAVQTNGQGIQAISWKSIGKAELMNDSISFVKDCLEEPAILKEEKSFVKYLKLIAKKDYVFVQNSKKELTGIITTYDMTMRFNDFLKPYMEIGLIEEALRKVIREKLDHEEVSLRYDLKDEKEVTKKVSDLTFFEYLRIIGDKENWDSGALKNLDRKTFLNHLDSIREIRNKIAHYSPNPLSESEKYQLEVTRELLLNMCT